MLVKDFLNKNGLNDDCFFAEASVLKFEYAGLRFEMPYYWEKNKSRSSSTVSISDMCFSGSSLTKIYRGGLPLLSITTDAVTAMYLHETIELVERTKERTDA